MDYDDLAKILAESNSYHVEVTRFKRGDKNIVMKETITFKFFDDNDYQWSVSCEPIAF